MKPLFLILLVCLHSITSSADTGIPFFKNYTASEYGAHNRNFDVAVGPYGVMFFANFEGLLYYDNDQWHILRTPGYARTTCLLTDTHGTLWVGGYNFVARVTSGPKRNFCLHPIPVNNTSLGEVTAMAEEHGSICLRNQAGQTFIVKNDTITPTNKGNFPEQAIPSLIKWNVDDVRTMEINSIITLNGGLTVLATTRQGLVVLDDRNRRKLYTLDESDGLCSNSISKIAEDRKGCLWGVTDNGIFRAYLPTMYTRYTSAQGLRGEVTTLARCKGQLYIGTLQGLYVEKQEKLHNVKGINHACWKLQASKEGETLYAATTEGVYRIDNSTAHKLTHEYAQTLCVDGTSLYIAEMNGISRLSLQTGAYQRIAGITHVMTLSRDVEGNITAQGLDGKIYRKPNGGTFAQVGTSRTGLQLFNDQDSQWQWATDIEGKNISCLSVGPNTDEINEKLKPLGNLTVRTLLQEGDSVLWIGGDFGTIRIGFRAMDGSYRTKPRLYFRQITIDGDSLLFGGIYSRTGHINEVRSIFASSTREITFHFSADAASAQGETVYQYQLEGYDKRWSEWSNHTVKSYASLKFGTYTFKVRLRDAFGRCSDIITYRFAIGRPFYLQWYSLAAYGLLLFFLIWGVVKWRLRGLIKDKQRLEAVVALRTEQIQSQKNEIEKKSANLAQALADLRHAQEDLLRQEKLATMGKLTRGLIDRILNPLNYINNFSHLSFGLTKELHQNLEILKGRMSDEEYEDADDLLGMLSSNLTKIEQHGGNTSRILKAMEEILKEHHRAKERIDLVALCRHSAKLVHEYYKSEIERMGIILNFHIPKDILWIKGNEEQLIKILMSLVNNSIYAISRKYNKQVYSPEIDLTLTANAHEARLTLKDNGTGIEPSIIGQVFDPFFTTKTTGEAAGVGLYLSREILIDHGGNITVTSVSGEYTEFTITIPI